MKRLPWFPFYADDWLNDENVRIADIATRGVYICLLCHQWREGSIPADVNQVMRLVGAAGSADDLLDERYAVAAAMKFFEPDTDGRLVNKRLAEIAKEQDELRAARSDAGRSGAMATNSKRAAKARQGRSKAEDLPPAKSGYSESESESETDSEIRTPPTPPVGSPSASPPVPDTPPIQRQLAQDAEIERRFARYNLDPEADDIDKAVLRRVLEFVTSDRVTGKPLPIRKRLKILDDLTRFQPGVVFFACHAFSEDGHIENGKDHHYLAGICEGSATSDFIEHQNEQRKAEDGIRTRKTDDGQPEVEARNPTPIRDLLVPHLRGGKA